MSVCHEALQGGPSRASARLAERFLVPLKNVGPCGAQESNTVLDT